MDLRTDDIAVPVGACRSCGSAALVPVLDLGAQPACDHFPAWDSPEPDPRWPLALVMCQDCTLVQLDHRSPAPEEPLAVESATLKRHAVEVTGRLLARLGGDGRPTFREFASHHGGHWAAALTAAGCRDVVGEQGRADLVVDNQSIIHAEDLQAELAVRVDALAPHGVLAIEFHHVLAQVEESQFDTVRHGHPLYFSLTAWDRALRPHGLHVVDAWSEDVFGGCIVALATRDPREPSDEARAVLAREAAVGLTDPHAYAAVRSHVEAATRGVRDYLAERRAEGRRVLGYGAGSKACTLLGVAQITPDLLPLVADLAPGKAGRRIPGVGIPIVSPDRLVAERPDEVLILTWDIAPEVVAQLRAEGLVDTRFSVPLPRIQQVGGDGSPR